jgi:glycosyltransferase involved in cell wall biosynthesis
MPELVTICIPTCRRPSLLLHAIHSCLLQDYRPLEIDISDDSLSSDTENLVQPFVLPPGVTLRYWRNSPPLGQHGNVNKLFATARGSKLVLLHDDDTLLPGAVSELYSAFSLSDSVIAAYGMQYVITENGEISPSDTWSHNNHSNRTPGFTGLQRDIVKCALWRQFPNNGYLVQTPLARAIGYRSNQEIGDACDTDFAIRLALANRSSHFAFVNRYASQYRLLPSSARTAHNNCWKAYDEFQKLAELTPEQRQARDLLLRKIAEQSVVDNAFHGRRKRALGIFFSSFYPGRKATAKAAYHLGLIAFPGLLACRDMMRGRS